MSTDFKKRFLMFMVPIFVITIALAIAVHFSGAYIQDTDLSYSTDSQSYSMTVSSEIKSVESTTISPDIDHRVDFDKFTIKITFTEPLDFRTTYKINVSLTDIRNKQSNISSAFKSSNPDYYFIYRDTKGMDTLYKSNVYDSQKQTVYQSEDLMFYALGKKSILVVDSEQESQSAKILINSKETSVDIPDDYLIDSIDGSTVSDNYVITLENKLNFERSLWMYSNIDGTIDRITDNNSQPLIGYDAQFASDGKSIFYFDKNMSVILLSQDSSKPPLNIGSFSELNRILPLNKGIFGFKQTDYLTIISSDGSESKAPETVQLSSQAQQLTRLTDYTYIKRELVDSRLSLVQILTFYSNSKETILRKVNSKETLILKSYLSPNDQYIVTEESDLPVIVDKLPKNGTAENVEFTITDLKTAEILVIEKGFDLKWEL